MYFNSIYWETNQLPKNASLPPNSTLGTVDEAVSGSFVTVLTSLDHPVNKRFYEDEVGRVQKVNFQNAYSFSATKVPASGIHDLARVIETYSRDNRCILIRGLPVSSSAYRVRKTKENFAEHSEGTQWAMLDFDDIKVPEGMDPLSAEAIEWMIARLPAEFHDATYFFQFSASAGILGVDGVPLKSGLNVHLFFWLDRRVPGKQLAAYLSLHCMQTGFYELG